MYGSLKKGVVALLLLGIFAALLPASAMAIPTTRLTLSTPAIYVGDSFTIGVFADNVDGINDGLPDAINAFDFDMVTPSGFTFTGITFGAPFVLNGFVSGANVYSDTTPAVSGATVTLATLSFTAASAGTFSFGITSDPLIDTGLSMVNYPLWLDMTTTLSNITVQPQGTVPEPSTLLLLGTGLIGAAVIRRASLKNRS